METYFRERSIVNHHIASYNDFLPTIDHPNSRMQKIVDNVRASPDESERGVIRLDPDRTDGKSIEIRIGRRRDEKTGLIDPSARPSVTVGRPIIKEANGATHDLYPMEARLRNLNYSAPIWLEFTVIEDGIEKEPEKVHIGDLPVMVKSKKCNLHRDNIDMDREPTQEELDKFLVDMGEDYTTHLAQLSRENCARHYASINDYVHAVFTVNQLFSFAESHAGQRHLATRAETVADALKILAHPPDGLDYYFGERIDNILPHDELEDERDEVLAIRAMEGLSPLETFVELVALDRTRYYRSFLTRQLDSVLMKNKGTCMLRQGKGKRNERRWHIGSRLLEMLVQIAVLEPVEHRMGVSFRSQPILIDRFVSWLRGRYGLVLVPDWPDATIQDYEAFNENLYRLKNRLREIGFYTDLSDAYNAQTIRPRYAIESDELQAETLRG